MPDLKKLKRIEKLGTDIDACADALRALKGEIGSERWLKTNDKLFNLIMKRDRLVAEMEEAK